MGHSKQNKNKKDGNHRVETREERKERLRKQEEARQACFKIMPYVGGVVLVFMIIFAVYVKRIPPKAPKTTPATTPLDTQRILQEALERGDIKLPEGVSIGDIKVEQGPPPDEGSEQSPIDGGGDAAPGEEPASEPEEERVEL